MDSTIQVRVVGRKLPVPVLVSRKATTTLCRAVGRSADVLHGTSWSDDNISDEDFARDHCLWLGLTPEVNQ